jgi:hypothetical protein
MSVWDVCGRQKMGMAIAEEKVDIDISDLTSAD